MSQFPRFDSLELESAREILWTAQPDTEEFIDAFATLRAAVEAGEFEYVGTVAESAALPGPCRDAALAYTLYYVANAIDGGCVAWANESLESGSYLGPAGDFRNEAYVADLVNELGLEAVSLLDARATQLLALHP